MLYIISASCQSVPTFPSIHHPLAREACLVALLLLSTFPLRLLVTQFFRCGMVVQLTSWLGAGRVCYPRLSWQYSPGCWRFWWNVDATLLSPLHDHRFPSIPLVQLGWLGRLSSYMTHLEFLDARPTLLSILLVSSTYLVTLMVHATFASSTAFFTILWCWLNSLFGHPHSVAAAREAGSGSVGSPPYNSCYWGRVLLGKPENYPLLPGNWYLNLSPHHEEVRPTASTSGDLHILTQFPLLLYHQCTIAIMCVSFVASRLPDAPVAFQSRCSWWYKAVQSTKSRSHSPVSPATSHPI